MFRSVHSIIPAEVVYVAWNPLGQLVILEENSSITVAEEMDKAVSSLRPVACKSQGI